MASVLAWRIPGTGEPGGLPSVVARSRTRLKWLSSSSSSLSHTDTHTCVEVPPVAPALSVQMGPWGHGSRLPLRSEVPLLSPPHILYSSPSEMFAWVLTCHCAAMHAEPLARLYPQNLAHPSLPSRLSSETPALGDPHRPCIWVSSTPPPLFTLLFLHGGAVTRQWAPWQEGPVGVISLLTQGSTESMAQNKEFR